ncbi:MAG: aminopeptidase [Gemmatimonadota bacterium]|nr:MAG: aminopeptidase [Gemmatimonadota bacterium]
MDDLKRSALIAVKDCMGLKPGETFLVITDEPLRNIGYALWEAGIGLGAESMLVEMIPRPGHGQDPPSAVAEMMKMVDVVLCPTSKSLTHTKARREACEAGARIGTLPGITVEVMARTLSADYHAIADRTRHVCEVVGGGRSVRLTAPNGTDLTMSIEGRDCIASTGLILNPGDFGNLPSGEAYLAPVEGTANGVFVVDGSFAGVGVVEEPLKLEVKDGFVTSISGGEEAEKLRRLLEPHGRDAFNIAELGIGTNDAAQISGILLEDEKVAGTVHIAVGNNASMGGSVTVPVHLDGVIKGPTLSVDDQVIMKDGKLLISLERSLT